jgi:hypothetical protein
MLAVAWSIDRPTSQPEQSAARPDQWYRSASSRFQATSVMIGSAIPAQSVFAAPHLDVRSVAR